MSTSPVSLRQLLAMDLLPGHSLLGGAAGLGRPLTRVFPGTSARDIPYLGEGTLVIFGPEQLPVSELVTDLAIRLAHSANSAGIVAQRPTGPVPAASSRLADKLAVPLVTVESVVPAAIVAQLDPYVRAPELAGLRMLGATAQRLHHPVIDPEQLTVLLAQSLSCPVTLVDAELRPIAGDRYLCTLLESVTSRDKLTRAQPSAGVFDLDGEEVLLVQPVQLDNDGPAHFWLLARTAAAASVQLRPIQQALTVAAMAHAVAVAARTARMEREARGHSLLLGEVLDQADDLSQRTLQRVAALGWRLAGWHTAVQIGANWTTSLVHQRDLLPELEHALSRHAIEATLIERAEGWVFWVTVDSEPDTYDPQPLLDGVQASLRAVESAHEGLTLCAGVGTGRPGVVGLRESLREARHACLLARTEETGGTVEHIEAMSVKRLLVSWYSSNPLRSVGMNLLNPLTEADSSGELLRTLRRYLDLESSATATAKALSVHRNTVIQRLEKIGSLLPVDLADPDDRLVVHLATRVAGIEWDDAV
ncbi:PucR C-terminal helix-turn-helix domain-containing protein [Haloechinothrix alba]|uniref:PucR C-terminal helix-turn-helix domain-containing protein n=1 Tax=Haloechinothrix alba TaxID=664784 RepID=A0A239A1I8_9PSEU|nr:PucR family transcriptional regulator [Haloechinothrix alba]SNR88968.1 PucR C-terminal helix-turn-helix domain-containing protein [Haloechinothrix alba]